MDDADYQNTRAHIDELIEGHHRKIQDARQKIDDEYQVRNFLGGIYFNAKNLYKKIDDSELPNFDQFGNFRKQKTVNVKQDAIDYFEKSALAEEQIIN